MYAQKKDSQIVHKDGKRFLCAGSRKYPPRRAKSAHFLLCVWYTADMPYLYAHTQFGLTVRDRLPAPLSGLLHSQHAAYLCGLIGPDVYFSTVFRRRSRESTKSAPETRCTTRPQAGCSPRSGRSCGAMMR